jgi:hypothetical protein
MNDGLIKSQHKKVYLNNLFVVEDVAHKSITTFRSKVGDRKRSRKELLCMYSRQALEIVKMMSGIRHDV